MKRDKNSTGYWMLSALVAGLLAVTTGCEDQGAHGGGQVAVVDMARVAQELGRREAFERLMAMRSQQVSARLAQVGNEIKAHLQAQEAAATTRPATERDEVMARAQGEAQARVEQEQAQARAFMDQTQTQFLAGLRAEIAPVARQIANSRGMSVVLARNESILDVAPTADITDDVIAEIRKTTPTAGVSAGPPSGAPGASGLGAPGGVGPGLGAAPPPSGSAPPMISRPPVTEPATAPAGE